MNNDEKLRRLCRVLSVATFVLAPLFAAGTAWGWSLRADAGQPGWWVSGLVALLSPSFLCVALFRAGRAFQEFSRGRYFEKAVLELRAFGAWCFWSALASLAAPTALSLFATVPKEGGSRHLEVSLSSSGLFALVIGALVWALAGVLAKARELEIENSQFV